MLTVIQQAGISKARAQVPLGSPGCSTAVLQEAEISWWGCYYLGQVQTKVQIHYWEMLTVLWDLASLIQYISLFGDGNHYINLSSNMRDSLSYKNQKSYLIAII